MPALAAPPPTECATRREFLALLGAAGLLTGCGAPTAAAPTAATRTVVDDLGRTVEVPVQPQRVVVLDEEIAAHVVTLGYVPAAVAWAYGPDFVSLFRGLGGTPGDLERIASVGESDAPDFEAIAAQAPDLVLWGAAREADGVLDRLTAIAPTVAVDARTNRDGRPFTQQRFLADLVGVGDAAEARIAEYRDRLAEVRARHGAVLAELEYVYWDTFDDGTSYTYDVPTFAVNAVLADLGAVMARSARELTAADPEGNGYGPVSVELMPGYDADVVFLGRYDRAPINAAVLEVMSTTSAARRGQLVHPVDAARWTFHLLQSQIEVLGEIAALLERAPVDASGAFR